MRCRQINTEDELLEIIRRCQWCHLAMVDAMGKPYMVPVNFGYRDRVIYLHGARQGKKISILRQNPSVCINFSTDQVLRYQNENVGCSWSMKYRSVLAYGKAVIIEEDKEKIQALNIIMSQYSDKSFKFNLPSIREVCVWKIPVEKMEGRAFGY